MATETNIKNLPEGTYFTEHGYSQSYPWKEISRTAMTVKLARVRVARDPAWKPEMIPGGFAAHCTNQHDQTWLFEAVDMNHTTTIRMTKKGWARKGTKFTEGRAIEFYDYNF